MKNKIIALALIVPLLGGAADATAASLTQVFRNDYDANRIWLWAVEPTTEFTGMAFLGPTMSAWEVTVDTGDKLFFQSPDGSVVPAPTGRYKISFDYVAPSFSFEWADIFWDGTTNNLLGAGTATWSGGWSGSSAFTHAADLVVAPSAVPLPNSIMFLASGTLFGLGFSRRTRRAA